MFQVNRAITNIVLATLTIDPLAKEAGDELRELYKKTLAAELTCQPGDPSADQVIEDIFGGGDGWGSVRDESDTASSRLYGTGDDTGNWSDNEQQQQRAALRENKRSWPDFQTAVRRMQAKHAARDTKSEDQQFRNIRTRGSFGQSSHRTDMTMDKDYVVRTPDLDELETREDLRCWISRPMS
jgi:hypothetical protein